ncbi:(Fe-S)-binding protein [Neobacillus mesonae]|uniref:Fe-S oxidoreductase n=1 Tax=Neobacillus mesonae TaxID=1193713 RepID=A0A3T0I030_9BACI|nr:(Fe-S)-binding protein [Neobacillus mesonae]AZU62679.1 Fe-S oxidoreductase [Neobacillus mesonae]
MKVSLLITCLSDVFFPQVGKSVVDLMNRCGVEVDFPEGQTCCGQPAYNSGFQKDAKKAAKQMIKAFEHSEYVVTPSGSCASMVCHYYKDLFKEEPEWYKKAEELAGKTYELTDFLVNILHMTELDSKLSETATFHNSCHMSRGMGIRNEPLQLLSQVEGLELKELPYCQDCCGFGGTFAAKMSPISEKMLDEKIEHIASTGANVLIGADLGCLLNIQGRLRKNGSKIQVAHIAEVLARRERSEC